VTAAVPCERDETPSFNPFGSYVGPCPTLWFSWSLTLSNPIFLPPAYSLALIYFGWERGWWITCNYPTVLKEKKRNRKSTTCAMCWLKSVLHEERCREQENHNVWPSPTWFSCHNVGRSLTWFSCHNVGQSLTWFSCSWRISSCSTDLSQQIAWVVLFLFMFFSFKTVG
jgi:hypothetical protein